MICLKFLKARIALGKPNWQHFGSLSHCWRCGGIFGRDIEPGSQVVHHIIPTSEGGPDSRDNRSLICGSCHAVVHRVYLPNNRIGKKRTRDGNTRIVAQFRQGVTISQALPSNDFALGTCEQCGTMGQITGATEGYWRGEGLLVFLDCAGCRHKFAIPFIGAVDLPPTDPLSVICSQ
jgi:hypothetical protein